jgi:hypothetical protein
MDTAFPSKAVYPPVSQGTREESVISRHALISLKGGFFMKGSLIRVGLAFALVASMAVGFASPTSAATANQCKTFKGYSTFSPPVPLANQAKKNSTISVHGTVGGCTPSNLTGGSGTVTGTLKTSKPGNCGDEVKGGGTQTGTSTTKWKNGKVSKFTNTVKEGTGSKYNIASFTGKITSGQFMGKLISGEVKFSPSSNDQCLSKPLSKVTFVQTKPLVLH